MGLWPGSACGLFLTEAPDFDSAGSSRGVQDAPWWGWGHGQTTWEPPHPQRSRARGHGVGQVGRDPNSPRRTSLPRAGSTCRQPQRPRGGWDELAVRLGPEPHGLVFSARSPFCEKATPHGRFSAVFQCKAQTPGRFEWGGGQTRGRKAGRPGVRSRTVPGPQAPLCPEPAPPLAELCGKQRERLRPAQWGLDHARSLINAGSLCSK